MATREESAFSGDPTGDRPAGPTVEIAPAKPQRIPVLDGWRACSILLVLGAHLVPLGPHWMALNDTAGAMGMALFFTLSGYLITSFLAGGIAGGALLPPRLAAVLAPFWGPL